MKNFIINALKRALRTGAQVFLTLVTVGQTISEINWTNVISVVLVAMAYSIATSFVIGIPEDNTNGKIETDGYGITNITLDEPIEKIVNNKKVVILNVVKDEQVANDDVDEE